MKQLTALVLLLVAPAAILAACATGATRQDAAPTARRPVLPSSRAIEVRLFTAFRAGLRSLSIATAVAGESGDIGQPVPTGVVERVSCRTARRCVVRWRDVAAHSHRTAYDVSAAARGCFDATADPALPGIFDVSTHAPSIHPLQELGGGVEPC